MGCFSFLCNVCEEPINSDSFRGERCMLFLLKAGQVMDHMIGEYDSYGRVFDENGESIEWNIPWTVVCDLIHSKYVDDGIAAVHEECYIKVPTTQSMADPNQGWGELNLPHIAWKR